MRRYIYIYTCIYLYISPIAAQKDCPLWFCWTLLSHMPPHVVFSFEFPGMFYALDDLKVQKNSQLVMMLEIGGSPTKAYGKFCSLDGFDYSPWSMRILACTWITSHFGKIVFQPTFLRNYFKFQGVKIPPPHKSNNSPLDKNGWLKKLLPGTLNHHFLMDVW